MGKWQPPIPAGALYSKPARTLGPALPLLAYFYDLVQRDGWIEFSLHEVAGNMDEPYPNVKRWWQMVEAGPFFCEVQKRGRKGIRACFRDTWLDWRIVRARDDEPDQFEIRNGTETGSELIPNDKNGIRNGTETGSELIPKERMHGTHDSDQADLLPPPPTQPPRAGGGGGGRFDQMVALFASYGIIEAEPLARIYRDAFPAVSLAELETLCTRLYQPDAGAHAGSRLYRALKHGPPKTPPQAATVAPLTPETYQPPPRLPQPVDPERMRRLLGKEIRVDT